MLNMLPELKEGAKVLEFSCGSGVFINSVYNKYPNVDVTGIELCNELAQLASLCYPKANIINDDALKYINKFKDLFDIVIGNPPFGEMNSAPEGFEHSQEKYEEYFVEMAVNCLKEGGEAILVVPDGMLSSDSSKKFRKWLLDECYYRGTISLPSETFYFSGTQCKTSVMYFKKKYKDVNPGDYPIFMATCNNIGWNSRGRIIEKCELDAIKNDYWNKVELKQRALFRPQEDDKAANY